MLKAVLIDDEEIALDVLEIVLQEVGGVTVERKFSRVDEALTFLEDYEADLVFLDIEMPGMNGMAVAEKLSQRWPGMPIIFVTAYQEYAVDAFEVNAFGYLLKPVSKDRLAKTLERFKHRHDNKAALEQEASALSNAAEIIESGKPGKLDKPDKPEKLDKSGKPMPETETERCLYLNVLGSMELYDSNWGLITWRTKKAKEMFAYLWHYNGTPVQRNRILDDLWPELPFDRAQALFHTTLYHVRNTLKHAGFPDMVMYGDERYWMRTERTVSDCVQLERLIRARTALAGSEEAVQLIKLYRGDYFEAEHYLWAEGRRNELRADYLHCLDRQRAYADRNGREALLRKMIALEPYSEAYYELLLQELQEAGNAAAVQALKELMVQRFQGELGIDLKLV